MTAAPAQASGWPDVQRAKKAIVVVDMVESVSLMQRHEVDVIDRWRRFVREVEERVLAPRRGRLVKSLGDGLLLEFELAPSAAAAAIDVQRRIGAFNEHRPADAAIALRVGAHVADVVVDSLDIYGVGVNLAARLATLAGPGEIIVSDEFRDQLVPDVDGDVEDMGECFLKHLSQPVRAYRLGRASLSPLLQSVAERFSDSERPVVAVIPFECTLGNDTGDLLGEALADEVIAQLARSPDLDVISGLSTRSLKGRSLGAAAAASHLGAAYVLSGRYRLNAESIRLTVELADVRNARAVWAQHFTTSTAAAFDPQAPLADRIVTEMARAILDREIELATTQPMPTLHGYTLLFGAITLMHRASLGEFDRARDMLDYLAHRQGRRSEAHAWLAKWHVLRVVQGWSPDAAQEGAQSIERVKRALDLNPHNGLALAIGGLVHGYLRKDLETAGRMYEDALAANPNEPLAWLFSATWHAYRGEGEAAQQAGDRALRLSPLDPMRYFFESLASTAMLASSDWQRSLELAQRSIRANRLHASTWRTLAYALVMLGRMDEARRAVRELLLIEPQLTVQGFLRRFPGRDGPMAEPWARALAEAGLPD